MSKSKRKIASYTGRRSRSFSVRDLTRVAWLNPDMWAELFLENRDNLIFELDTIIASLGQYRQALAQGDFPTLRQLLQEGKERKEEVDGR